MIQIRFNTNYPDKSDRKWRLLIDGQQDLVDDILILVPSRTSSEFVKGDDGQPVLKHHISCEGMVEYNTNESNEIIATIK